MDSDVPQVIVPANDFMPIVTGLSRSAAIPFAHARKDGSLYNDVAFVQTMSPVSHLSHKISSLSVIPPTAGKPPYLESCRPPLVLPQFQRINATSSARRRLSLSADSTTASSFCERSYVSPAKKSNSFCSISTTNEDVQPARVSPYRTPKRPASCVEEEEEDEEITGYKFPSNPPPRPLSASFDVKTLNNIKNKNLARVAGGSLAPLRRSSSATLFRNMPRPWESHPDVVDPTHPETSNFSEKKNTILPTINGQHPDLNCLATETVVELLNGRYNDQVHEFYIIDCRFPYEYEGGHINTALNLTEQQVQSKFINTPITDRKICIIFHCEFSSKRAPSSYRALRDLDRRANFAEYPKLYYPDVYYIDGGYKQFYEKHEEHCVGTYVEMNDKNHSMQFKHCNKIRNLKRTRSLSLDCYASTAAAVFHSRQVDLQQTAYF